MNFCSYSLPKVSSPQLKAKIVKAKIDFEKCLSTKKEKAHTQWVQAFSSNESPMQGILP